MVIDVGRDKVKAWRDMKITETSAFKHSQNLKTLHTLAVLMIFDSLSDRNIEVDEDEGI